MPLRFFLSFFIIFLFCSCSLVKPKLDEEFKISPFVMRYFPNSNPKDFKKCEKKLDLEKLYEKCRECALKEHKEISSVNKEELPSCFVVSEKSKDIVTSKKGVNTLEIVGINAFIDDTDSLQIQLIRLSVVGLFIEEENTILLIENPDLDRIYQHELYHWFLSKSNIADVDHSDIVWKKCTTSEYKPNKWAKIANWFKRLANLF